MQAGWLIEEILELTDLSLKFWYAKREAGLLNKPLEQQQQSICTYFYFLSKRVDFICN